ncbi:MAG: hypothetical protein K6F77_02010 [Lachnospiraceae bacterium]|nr:hypothetical protein [Lachnospiraceae bacterium]
MIEWNEKIYTDSVVNSKLKKYKKAILKNNSRKLPIKSFYVITFPFNSDNCFDIYSNTDMWLQYRKKTCDLKVVGIASSWDGCMDVLEAIVKEVLDSVGTFDAKAVKEYFGIKMIESA